MKPVETVKDWNGLYKLYRDEFYPIKPNNNKLKTWFFRGDNPGCTCPDNSDPADCRCSDRIDPSNILRSKIDKDFDSFGIEKEKRQFHEKYLFREFCRKQFLYTNYQPQSIIEKLALMRHHEGTTRLMDWTYSFFVAVYFAINSAKNYCVVWAIDENWIDEESKELHRKLDLPDEPPDNQDYSWYNEAVLKKFWDERYKRYRCIYPMTSFYLNKRLTLQRGTFLCQADITYPWYENFKEMKNSDSHIYQIKIKWNEEFKRRDEIINMLFEMNINQATLFHDLDGLAMSLRTKLASPQLLPKKLIIE